MATFFSSIHNWMLGVYTAWKLEFSHLFREPGAMIFFLLLPLAYPVVYTLIYNPELVRDVPVVVVDSDRSPESRQYVRSLDASQYIHIVGYAASKAEAQKALWEKRCYGVLEIPYDFSSKLNCKEAAHVDLYADMSLLVQYKGMLTALSEVTSAVGAHLVTSSTPDLMGALMPSSPSPIPAVGVAVGNPSSGFASFLMPGILILVIQQSLILGIVVLGAGKRERRLSPAHEYRNGIARTMLGQALCYYIVYCVMATFDLFVIPKLFGLPHEGGFLEVHIFIVPFIFATIFLAMALQRIASHREDAFLMVVFTSVIFLFLSGLTWPTFAIPRFWQAASWAVPSTWAVQGFIHLNSNGATLSQVAPCYLAMWTLTAIYFLIAYLPPKLRSKRAQ